MAKGDKAKTLDALGVEWLCDKLTAGETQTEICAELKIGIATLGRWIAADTERLRAGAAFATQKG